MRDRQKKINDTILSMYGARDANGQYLAHIWKYEYKFVEQTVEKWHEEILAAKQAMAEGKSTVTGALEKRLKELQDLYKNLD